MKKENQNCTLLELIQTQRTDQNMSYIREKKKHKRLETQQNMKTGM